MASQSLVMRKSLFAGGTDQSLISAYQAEVSNLSVDNFNFSDGGSDYKFDVNSVFQAQYNGLISFCTPTNDALLVSFIQTMLSNNPGMDFITFSQTITYGV